MINKISQSFIKSMRSYIAGTECGNITKAQWIDDRLIELDSKAVALGSYFEYILTGALPKNKIIPKPEMMASGKDMMAPYRLAHKNAERVKAYFLAMDLEIIHFGKKYTKGRHEGTVDIIARLHGKNIVIDTKYSGLIDDRWSEHGWQWSDIQKKYHGTQAIHYHIVTGLPFYFLVVSSANVEDVKLFHVPVSKEMIAGHIKEGNYLFAELNKLKDIGFIARPEISKCLKCPIREGCEDKHTFPHVEIVDLNIISND